MLNQEFLNVWKTGKISNHEMAMANKKLTSKGPLFKGKFDTLWKFKSEFGFESDSFWFAASVLTTWETGG